MDASKGMRVIEVTGPGDPRSLRLGERPRPLAGPGEILIRVHAAGVNNADTLQRKGGYGPPSGVTDILGLEVAGEVAALGEGVSGWAVGDRVCALLAGGGYAEYAVAPGDQCLRIPKSLSMEQAAALPEALFTCWTNLVDDGGLVAGQSLLVHGGASGIGTIAIAMARALGATVYATAGSPEKCDACRNLGAEIAINHRTEDFVAVLNSAGRQADVVLDMVGADYVARSAQVMAPGGRYVCIGLLSGKLSAEIPMGLMIMKRLRFTGSTLRGRSIGEKARIREAIEARLTDFLEDGTIAPVIFEVVPWASAHVAHEIIESGHHIGKIVLKIS